MADIIKFPGSGRGDFERNKELLERYDGLEREEISSDRFLPFLQDCLQLEQESGREIVEGLDLNKFIEAAEYARSDLKSLSDQHLAILDRAHRFSEMNEQTILGLITNFSDKTKKNEGYIYLVCEFAKKILWNKLKSNK
jgi:hypothetical protein